VLFQLLLFLLLFLSTISGASADATRGSSDSEYDVNVGNYDPGARKESDQKRPDHDADQERSAAIRANGEDNANDSDRRSLSADNDNEFNGSQFNPQTYIDTDFQKKSFIDFKESDQRKEKKIDWFKKKESRLADEGGDGNDDGPRGDRLKTEFAADREEAERKLHEAPADILYSDWVPSKVVRQDNGGFGIAEDNGAPVPYRLSGHINIERGFPWNPSD